MGVGMLYALLACGAEVDEIDDDDEEDGEQEVGLKEFLSKWRPAIDPTLSQARVDPPPTSSELRMRNKGKDKEV